MKILKRHVACATIALLMQPALAQVKLTDATRKNLGIEITTAAPTTVAKSWQATAQVLDAAPFVAQLGDVRAAELQAASSRNEADRLARLYQSDSNISLKALEAARAQSSSDAAKLQSLRAQWLTAYGHALATLSQSAREQLGDDLLAGRVVLARAETLQSVPSAVSFRSVRVRALNGDAAWDAEVLGPAAMTGQSVGNAYLLKIPALVPSGTLLATELHDPKAVQKGIKIPSAAILRWQGSDWVYLEAAPNEFERVMLTPTAWVDGGCLVQQGVTPGSKIVSAGAALLLAAESRSAEE